MTHMTVAQAAELLGCDPQFVRLGIQQGRITWGAAVRNKCRYTYVIYPEKFEEAMGIRPPEERRRDVTS